MTILPIGRTAGVLTVDGVYPLSEGHKGLEKWIKAYNLEKIVFNHE